MNAERVTAVATAGYFVTSGGALLYASKAVRQAREATRQERERNRLHLEELEKARVEDHLRRRKTETLEAYQMHATQQMHRKDEIFHRLDARAHIEKSVAVKLAGMERPRDAENPAKAVKGTPGYEYYTKTLIREYLNTWEVFAVGVSQGVFDFETLAAIARTRLMSCRDDFDEYITAAKKETSTFYEHFCQLADRLKRMGTENPLSVNDPLADYPSSSSRITTPQVPAKKKRRFHRN
jgi:hypothetical protein